MKTGDSRPKYGPAIPKSVLPPMQKPSCSKRWRRSGIKPSAAAGAGVVSSAPAQIRLSRQGQSDRMDFNAAVECLIPAGLAAVAGKMHCE